MEIKDNMNEFKANKKRTLNLKVHGERMYVVLRPKEETAGSLTLPKDVRQQLRIGVVKEVGEKVKYYKPGDLVAIQYYAGLYLNCPGYGLIDEKEKIVMEAEILGHVQIFEDNKQIEGKGG